MRKIKVTITCDGCGKLITGNPIRFAAEHIDRDTETYAELYQTMNQDYCRDCTDEILMTIKGYAKSPEKESQKEADSVELPFPELLESSEESGGAKPKENRSKKPAVDRGKVYALRDAGWSGAKIADEMRCSEARISQILKERSKTDAKD